ncbi:MAG TPA: hypothetical protein VGM88_09265 [Kofleriaceae bacterium]
MLLFHGTSGDRALVDKIRAEGLVPHGGRTWAKEFTGEVAHVFVCTSPIGTRGGDLGTAQRLAPGVRPRRGETLLDNLRFRAAELRRALR